MSSPSSPKPKLIGTLTVKVHRCADLNRSRMIGKMDPYVKLNVGGDEKFKTKVCEDGNHDPVFDQTFLFNLKGTETDLHLRVYDSETLSDTYIGRFDIPLMQLLENGGGARMENLVDPEQFRKVTGRIEISARFEGTGGPAAAAELAPITGPFHFQHNSTGFLVHAAPGAPAGSTLHLAAGGLHDISVAFEFQGPYIRSLANRGMYVTASSSSSSSSSDDSVTLQSGISDAAKWRWTGVGLTSASNGKILHPLGDACAAGTVMHLASGATPASGFSLVACKAAIPAQSPITPSTPAGAASAAAAAAASGAGGRPQASAPPMLSDSLSALSVLEGSWTCVHCTFKNGGNAKVCQMCNKTHEGARDIAVPAASPIAAAAPVFNLTFPDTWPAHVHTTVHQHVLDKLPEIYKGTYNCDVCRLQGQGIVYHCGKCSWDAHPACAQKNQKK